MSGDNSFAYGIGIIVIQFGCIGLSYGTACWIGGRLRNDRHQAWVGLLVFIAMIIATTWFAAEFLL